MKFISIFSLQHNVVSTAQKKMELEPAEPHTHAIIVAQHMPIKG